MNILIELKKYLKKNLTNLNLIINKKFLYISIDFKKCKIIILYEVIKIIN